VQKKKSGSAKPVNPHELLEDILMVKMMQQRKGNRYREDLALPEDPRSGAEHVGTTAVCVLLNDTDIVCANAGDSRAILCRDGKCMEMSNDHKPCVPDERKRILAAGGTVNVQKVQGRAVHRVNNSLSLSRSIGDLAHKKAPGLGPEEQAVTALPELIHVTRSPKDEFIVIACDGIWDVMTSQQVINFVRERLRRGLMPEEVSRALLARCLSPDPKETKGLGTDNMTCIIVVLVAPPPTPSITSQLALPTVLRSRFSLPSWCNAPNSMTKSSFREHTCEKGTQQQNTKAQKHVVKTRS
jgi:serine/threonine protein phosphatase PrpC